MKENKDEGVFAPDNSKFEEIIQDIVNAVEGDFDIVDNLSKLTLMYIKLADGYEALVDALSKVSGIAAGAIKNVKL